MKKITILAACLALFSLGAAAQTSKAKPAPAQAPAASKGTSAKPATSTAKWGSATSQSVDAGKDGSTSSDPAVSTATPNKGRSKRTSGKVSTAKFKNVKSAQSVSKPQ